MIDQSSNFGIFSGRRNINLFLTRGYASASSSDPQQQQTPSTNENTPNSTLQSDINKLQQECLASTELIFRKKLNWLLVFAPIALMGKSGWLGESTCFVLAGLALIPLAEVSCLTWCYCLLHCHRMHLFLSKCSHLVHSSFVQQRLSFVTEEVAEHTNQTIGALLNATFGNAPELLISSAALKEGFYRVVQLTLLGSMLTNLLFVFGLSCLIGGLRFQVQELRIVTGNASVGMLMLAVAGLALPAALTLSDEMLQIGDEKSYVDKNGDGVSDINDGASTAMVGFSRFNAAIMVVGYLMYLLFQLGTHKEEFEDLEEESDDENQVDNDEERLIPRNPSMKKKARKNKFCRRLFVGVIDDDDNNASELGRYQQVQRLNANESIMEIEMAQNGYHDTAGSEDDVNSDSYSLPTYIREKPTMGNHRKLFSLSDVGKRKTDVDDATIHRSNVTGPRSDKGRPTPQDSTGRTRQDSFTNQIMQARSSKSHCSDGSEEDPHSAMMPLPEITQNAEESTSLWPLWICTLSVFVKLTHFPNPFLSTHVI
jgi:calcium/proton exchanger cax